MTADEDLAIAGSSSPVTGAGSTPPVPGQWSVGDRFRRRAARRVHGHDRGGWPARSSGRVIRGDRGRAIALGIACRL